MNNKKAKKTKKKNVGSGKKEINASLEKNVDTNI